MCVYSASHVQLCHPMDCSLPGASVHGVFQARIVEGVAISSSRVSSWPRDQIHASCIDRQILYHWATCEAHGICYRNPNWLRQDTKLEGFQVAPDLAPPRSGLVTFPLPFSSENLASLRNEDVANLHLSCLIRKQEWMGNSSSTILGRRCSPAQKAGLSVSFFLFLSHGYYPSFLRLPFNLKNQVSYLEFWANVNPHQQSQ